MTPHADHPAADSAAADSAAAGSAAAAPLTDREAAFAERVSEAQDLVNQGHTISGEVLHRSLGAASPALGCAARALDALQEAVPSAAAPELAEGDRVGGCEIRGVIGRGGMGTVYEAVELTGGPTIALKVLSPALAADTEALLRFKREAELAGRLKHPHVVGVFGAGEHDSLLYYKMERVEGGSLQTALEQARTAEQALPDTDECRTLAGRFAGVADALEAAHALGVVHRDVKPGNILMGESGRLQLVDFGIARAAGAQTLTATSAILGTPLYMAPEQALGRTSEIGPATDIYGLGATLYETVTGQPIFDPAEGYAGLVGRIVDEPPRAPRRLNPAIPRGLEAVIARCLEKRPSARYASAAELRDDLRRVAESRPVRTHRVSAIRRLARQLRRRPLAAATVVGLLSVVAVIAAFALRPPASPFAEDATAGWIRIRQDAWIQLFASNDAPALARIAGKMTAWNPTSTDEAEEARILRAWVDFKRQANASALRILGDPTELKSEKAARTLQAFILRSDWRYVEARAEARRAEALPARSRLDHALHALSLTADRGDRERGRDVIEKLVETCPDYLPARIVQTEILKRAGDTRGAVAACGTLLLMRPNHSTLLMLRGLIYRDARRIPDAIRAFRAAIAADPRNEEARVSLYYLLWGSGKEGRAEAGRLLAEGLEVEPRSRWLLNARGWKRQGQGDLDGAVADYEAALGVDPRFTIAQINLGNARIRQGRRDEALRFWQALLDDPDQPTAAKAAILAERSVHRFRRGEKAAGYADLEQSLRVHYRPYVQGNLANHLIEDDRFSQAAGVLDQLLELVPNDAAARARRGKCRLWTGDLAGARADLEQALKLRGKRAAGWMHVVRAELAVLADDAPTADAVFARAAEKRHDARNLRWLEQIRAAWLLDQPGREEEARATLERGERAAAKNPDPRKPGPKKPSPKKPDPKRAAMGAALRVRLAARAPGEEALAAWKNSPLPALPPDFAGGEYERLRIWIALAFPTPPATGPGERWAALARARIAGQNLDEDALRAMPAPPDARTAWILGEAWLTAGRGREALPHLERAAEGLGLAKIRLDLAVALALAGAPEKAGAALEQALAAGLTRWSALRRLTTAKIPIQGPIRQPLRKDR